VQLMGHNDESRVWQDSINCSKHTFLGYWIERGSRLAEDQDLRAVQKRSRDRSQLAFAVREISCAWLDATLERPRTPSRYFVSLTSRRTRSTSAHDDSDFSVRRSSDTDRWKRIDCAGR
jgi:hypothetical protein